MGYQRRVHGDSCRVITTQNNMAKNRNTQEQVIPHDAPPSYEDTVKTPGGWWRLSWLMTMMMMMRKLVITRSVICGPWGSSCTSSSVAMLHSLVTVVLTVGGIGGSHAWSARKCFSQTLRMEKLSSQNSIGIEYHWRQKTLFSIFLSGTPTPGLMLTRFFAIIGLSMEDQLLHYKLQLISRNKVASRIWNTLPIEQ